MATTAFPDRRPIPISFAEILSLLLLAFAAYGTVAWNYHLFADDFIYRESGPDRLQSIALFHPLPYVWRIFPYAIIGSILRISPAAYMTLAVFLHAINGLLLLTILRQLGLSRAFSLVLAVLFLTCPSLHEAVGWAAASCYLWATFCFLVTIATALSWSQTPSRPIASFFGFALLALWGNLFGEQTSMAYLALPLIVVLWSYREISPKPDWKKYLPLTGITIGTLLFIALMLLTTTPSSDKHVSINLKAFLSPVYYQYTLLYAYAPWLHPGLVGKLSNLTPQVILFTAITLAAGLGLFWKWLRSQTQIFASDDSVVTGSSVSFPLHQLLAGLLLFVGIYAVFVFGGGYSLDSRKRYNIVIGLILLIGPCLSSGPWQPLTSIFAVHKARGTAVLTIFFALIAFNVSTSVFLTAIHKTEIVRQEKLQKWILVLPSDRTYNLDPYRQRQALWKYLAPFWMDFYQEGLIPGRMRRIYAPEPAVQPRFYFDLKADCWTLEGSLSPEVLSR
jgi:hypothetical protein